MTHKVDKPEAEWRSELTPTQYHVLRAWLFWPALPETEIQFAHMLSQPLRDYVCGDRECARSCINAFDGCAEVCKLPDEIWAKTCPTP